MAADAWVLQALVDANDQAVFVLDSDFRYLAFNRAHVEGMRALYGAGIELGGRLTDYQTVADDREGAKEHVGRALAGERVVVGAFSGEEGRERRFYDLVHTPLTGEDGTVVGVVVRTYDVTDRRVAEDGLRAVEERYSALFESMLEGYAYCRMQYDENGLPDDWVYLAVNPAFEQLTGLVDVAGKRVTEVIPTIGSESPELFDLYGAVARTGEPAEFDIDFTPLDKWLHVSAFQPEPDHFIALFADVSESRRAERAAARSHAELKTLVDTVPEIVFQVDGDYRLVVANELFTQATISAERRPIWPGDTVLAPEYPDEFNEIWRGFYDRALAGESFAVETTVPMEDGEHVMDNHLRPVRDADGEVVGAIIASRDITDGRRAEQAVRDSEARYRGYFEQSLVGAAVTSPEKGWIEVNQATCDLLGYTREELAYLTWADLTHPDDLAADVAQFERVMAGVVDGYRLEKRFVHKDGKVIDVDLSVKCERAEGGAVDYFLALLSDVTERKALTRELDDERQRFRLLVENSGEAFLLSQPDGTIHFANPQACRMFGRTEEDVRAIGRDGIVDTTDPRLEAGLRERALTGNFGGELRFVRSDGTTFEGELSTSVYADHLGVERTSMVIRDLTERIAAQAALRESEEQHRTLFESMPQGVIYQDGEGHITAANPAAERIVGLSLAQMQGLTSTDPRWRAIREDGSAFPGEEHPLSVALRTGRRIDGVVTGVFNPAVDAYRWVKVGAVPQFRPDEDKPYRVFATFDDITELKRVEAELRELHDRLEFAQHASGAGIWDWDVVTGVIGWSPEMFALLGLDATTDVAGFDAWNKAMHPDDLEAANARLGEALAEHAVLDNEYRVVRPNGEVRWINALGQGVYDERGEPLRMSGMCIDITERKSTAAAIERLNVDLERRVAERTRDLTAANAELEEFVHSIAHDLRSPLRALSGFSELIETDYADVIDDTGRDYLRRIRDAAGHLGRLMDALLSLSQIGRLDVELRDVDLSALALEVAEELQATFPERDVDVEVEQGMVAHGDPALCEIIVQNLLGNAWKCSAGEKLALVRFHTERVDGRRVFCVSDNGVGFDPAYAGKLFAPFERLHTRDEFPGTGIGLATVRRAVTRLGGRCWADAEQDGGARVYFSLGEED